MCSSLLITLKYLAGQTNFTTLYFSGTVFQCINYQQKNIKICIVSFTVTSSTTMHTVSTVHIAASSMCACKIHLHMLVTCKINFEELFSHSFCPQVTLKSLNNTYTPFFFKSKPGNSSIHLIQLTH